MSQTKELGLAEKTPHHSELEAQTKEERDTQVLARLGKNPVLEVGKHCQLRELKLTGPSVVSASLRFADSPVRF